MADFEVVFPLLGGVLIGLASALVLWAQGRVAGISGIVGGVLDASCEDRPWRFHFLLGLLAGGGVLLVVFPQAMVFAVDRSVGMMVVAGLLVGFGTRLGNGCTSGHGVCGLPRLSKRSFVAVMTFMATGMLTATAVGLIGGQS